jgi:hypothetical protein
MQLQATIDDMKHLRFRVKGRMKRQTDAFQILLLNFVCTHIALYSNQNDKSTNKMTRNLETKWNASVKVKSLTYLLTRKICLARLQISMEITKV